MKAILIVLALAVLANATFTDREYQFTFTSWMRQNNKQYSSEEFQQRFAAFKDNMDYIQNWNAQGSDTVLGLTSLADLTNAEYQKIYLGTRITVAHEIVEQPTIGGDNYNISVDWRPKGAVTPIKDQGQCGSCWSFSATGSMEGAYFLKNKKLVSLSEQNLVDCSSAEGNEGCNGGLMDQAFEYVIKNKGIDTEASYPYTAKDGKCKFDAANVGATITSYKDVTKGDEGALQTAVAQQPVSVAIDASHSSFQLYSSGVYHEKACSASQLDHGVLAVGYGTDTTTSKNFWIVKNSWGLNWGQQGYIYMTKDKKNECGIATAASYPIA
jgi:cathepsin L